MDASRILLRWLAAAVTALAVSTCCLGTYEWWDYTRDSAFEGAAIKSSAESAAFLLNLLPDTHATTFDNSDRSTTISILKNDSSFPSNVLLIVQRCEPLPYIFALAAIIALTPVSPISRLRRIALGSGLLFATNASRIALLTYTSGTETFDILDRFLVNLSHWPLHIYYSVPVIHHYGSQLLRLLRRNKNSIAVSASPVSIPALTLGHRLAIWNRSPAPWAWSGRFLAASSALLAFSLACPQGIVKSTLPAVEQMLLFGDSGFVTERLSIGRADEKEAYVRTVVFNYDKPLAQEKRRLGLDGQRGLGPKGVRFPLESYAWTDVIISPAPLGLLLIMALPYATLRRRLAAAVIGAGLTYIAVSVDTSFELIYNFSQNRIEVLESLPKSYWSTRAQDLPKITLDVDRVLQSEKEGPSAFVGQFYEAGGRMAIDVCAALMGPLAVWLVVRNRRRPSTNEQNAGDESSSRFRSVDEERLVTLATLRSTDSTLTAGTAAVAAQGQAQSEPRHDYSSQRQFTNWARRRRP